MGPLERFISSDMFMPHGHCFAWTPSILYTWVVSDLAIAASYVSIPLALIHIIRKRGDIPFNALIFLFAAFILFCGASHAVAVWTLWHPNYGFEGIVKAATASVSVVTAIMIWRLAPAIIGIPSNADLERANEASMRSALAERDARKELERSAAALQEANERLESFAHMASHDLRAPVKAVINLADIARSQPAEEAAPTLALLRKVAGEMEQLISGYRRLSRLQLDSSHVGVTTVAELVESAQAQSESPLEVVVSGSASLECDASLMTAVFVNLLGNAAKYGRGDALEVRCREQDDHVIVEVSNPVERPLSVDASIFAPFRRLTKDSQGSGLGLAICRRVVQLHHGLVEAACNDRVFTITMTLPASLLLGPTTP